MEIAILGWGSLIWDPRDLPFNGDWESGGPELPIEFSRISRDCRLTLVIDPSPSVGELLTRFALSPRTTISDVVEDLRKREGTITKWIGFYSLEDGNNSFSSYPDQVDISWALKEWLAKERLDACVWTALLPNFKKEKGVEFSVEAAVDYLALLPKSARKNALKYIWKAPTEVHTQVREAVTKKWPPP